MNPQVPAPKDALASFCQAHGIKRLAVFGSALREDFGPESDIDLLRRKRAVLEELFKAPLHKLMIGEIRVGELGLGAWRRVDENGHDR